MKLKDQIRLAREALGITQEELARRLDVSKQAVIFWEDGKGPKLGRIADIEHALHTKFNISGNKTDKEFIEQMTAEDAEHLVVMKQLPREQYETVTSLARMLKASHGLVNPAQSKAHFEERLYKHRAVSSLDADGHLETHPPTTISKQKGQHAKVTRIKTGNGGSAA